MTPSAQLCWGLMGGWKNERSIKPKNLMSKEMQIKLPTLLFSQQKKLKCGPWTTQCIRMRLNYGSSVGNRKLLMHCVAGAKWKVSPFCQETVFNDFEKKCRWPLRGNSVFNRGMRSLQGEKDFFHRLVGAKTKAAPLSEDEACRLFVFVCSHKLVLPLGLCCKKSLFIIPCKWEECFLRRQ